MDALEIPPGGNFRLMLSASAPLFADRLEMYFSDCEFTDAEPWKAEKGDLVDVGETHTLQGRELERLRKRAGDDAIIYPETQDRFWRCVCGRINPLDETECARCRRSRDGAERFRGRHCVLHREEEDADIPQPACRGL